MARINIDRDNKFQFYERLLSIASFLTALGAIGFFVTLVIVIYSYAKDAEVWFLGIHINGWFLIWSLLTLAIGIILGCSIIDKVKNKDEKEIIINSSHSSNSYEL